MRKIIVFESITLDGYMAGPNGEIDWAIRDEEITKFTQEGDDKIDTFMFGRTTYDMMAKVWPTPMGKSMNPVFAEVLNKNPKIVFSSSLENPEWENTKVINNIYKEEMLKLKQMEGGNIMIFGSQSIVSQLANFGLIDEYQFLLNPIVLSKGKKMFGDLNQRLNLKLDKSKQFKSGIMFLKYVPR